jgi:glycosyltransferase involved in cell wall biosynthesis
MVGSNSAKEELVRIMHIPENNITIVPHGVVVIKPTTFSGKSKIMTITFLGALAKDKGIEDALQAFSILNKRGNFQFWVIGKAGSPYDDFLKNLVFRFGLKNNVIFWGFVDQKKKFELLAKSHILINPSFREGWGLVNIEANSVGIPVVAYSSPGLIDSVKDGESGALVKKNSPEELAEAIIEILKDGERFKHLQAGALSWSKNFSWEKSRERSLTLINSLI